MREPFSQAQEDRAIALYRSGLNLRQAGERMGCSAFKVRRCLLKNGVRLRGHAEPEFTPTPEEIAKRSAEVRAGWNEDDEYRRRVGTTKVRDRVGYTIPICSVGAIRHNNKDLPV